MCQEENPVETLSPHSFCRLDDTYIYSAVSVLLWLINIERHFSSSAQVSSFYSHRQTDSRFNGRNQQICMWGKVDTQIYSADREKIMSS